MHTGLKWTVQIQRRCDTYLGSHWRGAVKLTARKKRKKARIISCRDDLLREFLGSPPPLSLQPVTNINEDIKKKSHTKRTNWRLFVQLRDFACFYGSGTCANVHLSECFQPHGQRNFIVYTLAGPRDYTPPSPPPPPPPSLLPSLPPPSCRQCWRHAHW